MNTGPAPGSPARGGLDDRRFVDKCREAFKDHPGSGPGQPPGTPPDWVLALAEYCDQPGVALRGASKALGYSTSVISTVVRGKYVGGDMARVEEKVRGLLMGLVVACPELGELNRSTCLDWQKKPRAQTSSLRTRMYRACRRCPHFRHANASEETVHED